MEFIKGDCLEVMKTLPSKSIDCFVCDLPYGCLTGGAGKEKKKRQLKRFVNGVETHNTAVYTGGVIAGCSWDIKIDLVKFWEQVKRLAKDDHTPVLMFCNTRFGAELIASNPSWFRYDLVWNKSRGVGFLCANKQPLRSHELIYIFSKKGAYYKRIDIEGDFPAYVGSHSSAKVYNLEKPNLEGYKKIDSNKRCVKSVININNETNKGKHPTQKPAELYEWLLKRYCPIEGTILDPTAGSFTSCFEAKKLGLKSIGIEMNEEFFDKAEKQRSLI
jgi:site-specific DNA-methyltransferase (adenine-specific)